MVNFQDYQFTSGGDFAKYVQKSKLAFLYVHDNTNKTSLIETISIEPDELYLSVDISKVPSEVRNHLLSLSPICQQVYRRVKKDIPYLETFITGMGFVGIAFEPAEVEKLISRSREDKASLERFHKRTGGNQQG